MRNSRDLTAIRDMSRLFDIRDVLSLNGRSKAIVCPLPQHVHHHRTPSFSIFVTPGGKQRWKCFGSCALDGDVVDLVGYLHISGYNPKSGDDVKAAIAILSGCTRINPPKPQTTKAPMLANGLYKTYLPAREAVLEYARERFLTSETLERFFVGQHHSGTAMWMTMPTLHGDRLRGIKMRNLNAKDKRDRYAQAPGSVDGLFNYNQVNSTQSPVLIVKGEIAVMVLSQFGILACSPSGGEASYYKHEELLIPLAFSSRRIVVGDNDIRPDVREKMQQAAARRKEIFKAGGLYFPPDPFVGVDDWILAEPEVAIPLIKSWMEQ